MSTRINKLPLAKFAKEKLRLEVWSKFEEIFQAVESGERKILIRSGNGAGKTTALAAICNWYLASHKECIVLTSAASATQLRNNLWGEIRRQARRSLIFGKTPIRNEAIRLSDKRFAVGISPGFPESAQGYHAANMLIAIDEATSTDRDIMNALLANATGANAQIILTYNPLSRIGFPYTAEGTNGWKLFTISAMEHPNIMESQEVIPGAVTKEWIDDRIEHWSFTVEPESEHSFEWNDNWYRRTAEVDARIFGTWPLEGANGLFPMKLLTRSLAAEATPGMKVMGVDIARGGADGTVFAFFDGSKQLPLRTVYNRDLVTVADEIAEYYAQGFSVIAVDDTGVGGGVTDILKEKQIPVYDINFARHAKGFFKGYGKEMANTRTEMYFVLLEEIKKREIKLVDDRPLLQELSAVELDLSESNPAYKLGSKETIHKRIGRSPDRADATALARYAFWLETKIRKQIRVIL